MSRHRKPFNPFYALLMVAGTVFAVTACAYGVMMVRSLSAAQSQQPLDADSGLMAFLESQGDRVLMIELGVLAIATVAAIGTDEFWTRRAASRQTKASDVAQAVDSANPAQGR